MAPLASDRGKDARLFDSNLALMRFLQQWCVTYFKATSLRDLGLRIRPSHRPEESCPTASLATDVVVLHTNGIHAVSVEFCKCLGLAHRTQLLRIAWWPATPFDPKTCATFELLRQFHLLNLQGKLPAYDFCRALELQTDNTGLQYVPVSGVSPYNISQCSHARLQDRSELFMVMVREWRHVTLAKRAGRGHDSTGIAGTNLGGLAVRCRACPHPGVNLPDGWQDAKPEDA